MHACASPLTPSQRPTLGRTQPPLPGRQTEYALRDTPGGRLLVAGVRVAAAGREHAAAALLICSQQQLDALNGAGGAGTSAAAPSSSSSPAAAAGLMEGMAGSRLHWGSVRSEGAKWQSPEAGWNTFPADSIDGGAGAVGSRPAEHI